MLCLILRETQSKLFSKKAIFTYYLQDTLKSKLENLDKSFLSTKTNLSAGLAKALDVFREANLRYVCKRQIRMIQGGMLEICL